MKSKKNKLTNLLKTGILLFGISLFLWNCNNENETIENNQSNLLEKLQSNFNAENFKEALPYDFEVQWDNSLKQYSEELETSYYEFPITYTSKFNPDEILKSKPQKNKYNISYKILITENEKQEYIYYVVKFYKENSKNTSHLEKSFAGSSDFSGFIHLLNKSGDIVFAKKLEGGIEDSKKFYNKEFKKKRNKDENLYARVDETCITLTTHSYTDNYVRWGNGPAIYVSTTYNGSTSTTSCESYWLPGLNIGGGGGAGTYRNNGNGGVYKDSNTPTRHQIRDLALECEQGYVYDAVLEKCVLYQIFNELTGKDKCIYTELEKLNLFKQTIGKFSNGKYNLTVKYGTICNGGAGEEACTDASDLHNGNMTIKILGSGTQSLDFAATLLHEGIHAEIYKYVDEYKKGVDPNNKQSVFYYYNYYSAKNNNRFETSIAQHQHMQDVFIIPIAKAIRQLDNYRLPLENYYGFGWEGLKEDYKYDNYIDSSGNVQVMTPQKYTDYINKMYNVISTTNFKDALKNCN